jgi:hypothetical protein
VRGLNGDSSLGVDADLLADEECGFQQAIDFALEPVTGRVAKMGHARIRRYLQKRRAVTLR